MTGRKELEDFGCTTDRAQWEEHVKGLVSGGNYTNTTEPNMVVEDLSNLITTQTNFTMYPVFLYEGKPSIARTRRFSNKDEATKYANNMKVLYHYLRMGQDYVVRGLE